jgi:hypothetical protein
MAYNYLRKKEDLPMKSCFTVLVILAIIAGCACAEERNFSPKDTKCVIEREPQAKEPVGAIVETAGVFTGKILSAAEIAFTGERKIMVKNETGECRIFPFCATTKMADDAFNAVTFNQLKKGYKVKVEYSRDGDTVKAQSVTVER